MHETKHSGVPISPSFEKQAKKESIPELSVKPNRLQLPLVGQDFQAQVRVLGSFGRCDHGIQLSGSIGTSKA
jgi:hypothetical protein